VPMVTVRLAAYAAAGATLLILGAVLIFVPSPNPPGLGLLLVIFSSVPFALAYSASMRRYDQLEPS
jgi:hypothetical protein